MTVQKRRKAGKARFPKIRGMHRRYAYEKEIYAFSNVFRFGYITKNHLMLPIQDDNNAKRSVNVMKKIKFIPFAAVFAVTSISATRFSRKHCSMA